MKTKILLIAGIAAPIMLAAAGPAGAATVFHFSTGSPDGKLGALSQPANESHFQTETADDFVLGSRTRLTSATFTGLLTDGARASDVKNVEIEFYRVFPGDSAPSDNRVTTRANSPADVEIASATRDGAAGTLDFTTDVLNPQFVVSNTVTTVNGLPGEFTGGDRGAAGEEVQFNVNFSDPVLLGAEHLFFRPEVELNNGTFLWLSAPRPIGADGTPFPAGTTDLQAWIRNDRLAPDWVRIGTDVTHQGPFNMSFSLSGVSGVPEPTGWALMILGCGLTGATLRARRAARAAA
jgi:hypothetical protein